MQRSPICGDYCTKALQTIKHGGKTRIGPCLASQNAIALPNGMALTYHNLRWVEKEKYNGWAYDFGGRTRTIWGGKVVENIAQSLARIKIMTDMLKIKHELGISPALQAHDELVYCVLERDAEQIAKEVKRMMEIPTDWAPDLPLKAEVKFGPTYGDAK